MRNGVTFGDGGAEGSRTPDLCIANAALSQLSYGPETCSLGRGTIVPLAHRVNLPVSSVATGRRLCMLARPSRGCAWNGIAVDV